MAAAVGPGVAVGVAVGLAHGVADIEAEVDADADADAGAESEGEGVLSLLPQAAATARTATKVSARRADRYLGGDEKRARVGRIVLLPHGRPAILASSSAVRSPSVGPCRLRRWMPPAVCDIGALAMVGPKNRTTPEPRSRAVGNRMLARPAGLEPTTSRSATWRSIH